jgi:CheY-like chemotaxis protein
MPSTEAINDGPGHRIRVLVVDDSAFARSVISRQLSADPEIEVVGHAADGIEALEQIRSLRPDVVTLDISMPRMDGIETLEHIVRDIPTPTVMVSVPLPTVQHYPEALDKCRRPCSPSAPAYRHCKNFQRALHKSKLAATARLIPRPRKIEPSAGGAKGLGRTQWWSSARPQAVRKR